jgi:hypothetical protein
MIDVTAVFEGKKLAIVAVHEKVQKICDEIMKIVKNKPLWRTFLYQAQNYDTKEYVCIESIWTTLWSIIRRERNN